MSDEICFKPTNEDVLDQRATVRGLSPEGTESVARRLGDTGFVLLAGRSEEALRTLLGELGQIINEADVTVRPGSRALVTSAKALDLHTDHHRADIMVLHCLAQCDEGGETLLADARAAFAELAEADRRALEGVRLYEHKVFPDDPDSHPLVEYVGGEPQFYYSYWLLSERLNPAQTIALDRFRVALRRNPPLRLRLRPGDSLLVMNRRVLHGRTAINGTARRLLRRFWVSCKRELAI